MKYNNVRKELNKQAAAGAIKNYLKSEAGKTLKSQALGMGAMNTMFTGFGKDNTEGADNSFGARLGRSAKTFAGGAALGTMGGALGSELHSKKIGAPRKKGTPKVPDTAPIQKQAAPIAAIAPVGAALKGMAGKKFTVKAGSKLLGSASKAAPVAGKAATTAAKTAPTVANAGANAAKKGVLSSAASKYKTLHPRVQDAIGGGTVDVAWGGFGKDQTPGADNSLKARAGRMAGDFASGAVFDAGLGAMFDRKYDIKQMGDGSWERHIKDKYK